MRICIYIVIVFGFFSCSGETPNDKRSNDVETYHRLNYVNLLLPKAYQPLTSVANLGTEYEWLIEGLNLKSTDSKNIYFKKENDELRSIVQVETRGRKVTMDGANYNEFLELIKKGAYYMPISIVSSKVIEDKYDIESDPKYFKVKSLLLGEEQNLHFTCYLVTNASRTIGLTVWNLSEDQNDLEDFVKRFELF